MKHTITAILASNGKPFTKRFERGPDGSLIKHPHPKVSKVISEVFEYENLQELTEVIQQLGAAGAHLLKGLPLRPIQNESRARLIETDGTTRLLVLDLDGIEGADDVKDVLKHADLEKYHHIVQYSASSGVEGDTSVKAHVFFELAEPVEHARLEEFCMELNLVSSFLRDQMSLTKSGMALHWRVDRVANRPAQPIFIAPPIIGDGVTCSRADSERVVLVEGEIARIEPERIDARGAKWLQAESRKLIAQLRADAGLPKRTARDFKMQGDEEVALGPNVCQVTAVDDDPENLWVGLALDGGNLGAYYYWRNNPTYLRNHKGEPLYRLEEICPDYWRDVVEPTLGRTPIEDDRELIAFAARSEDAALHEKLCIAKLDHAAQRVSLCPADTFAKPSMYFARCAALGLNVSSKVKEQRSLVVVSDPTPGATYFDADKGVLNTWSESDVMRRGRELGAVRDVPPLISRLLDNVLVTPEVREHFLNWGAVIVQFRRKTGSAFVFRGGNGSGKDKLFELFAQIIGPEYTVNVRQGAFTDTHTGFLRGKLLVLINEVNTGKLSEKDREQFHEEMKRRITDQKQDIRAMRVDREAKEINRTSYLLATNRPRGFVVESDERRYTVTEWSAKPLVFLKATLEAHGKENFTAEEEAALVAAGEVVMTNAEADQLVDELPQFAAYLLSREADVYRAARGLPTAAAAAIAESSMGTVESMFEELESLRIVDGILSAEALESTHYPDDKLRAARRALKHGLERGFEFKAEELAALHAWSSGQRNTGATSFGKRIAPYLGTTVKWEKKDKDARGNRLYRPLRAVAQIDIDVALSRLSPNQSSVVRVPAAVAPLQPGA